MDPRPTGRSLGMVETRGFTAAVEAADAMTKTARVSIVRHEVVPGARVTILVRGELAEVEAAVAAFADDGPGPPAGDAWMRGSGIAGMQARMRAVGGSLEVMKAPGGGTIVRGEVPLRAPAGDPAAR